MRELKFNRLTRYPESSHYQAVKHILAVEHLCPSPPPFLWYLLKTYMPGTVLTFSLNRLGSQNAIRNNILS